MKMPFTHAAYDNFFDVSSEKTHYDLAGIREAGGINICLC